MRGSSAYRTARSPAPCRLAGGRNREGVRSPLPCAAAFWNGEFRVLRSPPSPPERSIAPSVKETSLFIRGLPARRSCSSSPDRRRPPALPRRLSRPRPPVASPSLQPSGCRPSRRVKRSATDPEPPDPPAMARSRPASQCTAAAARAPSGRAAPGGEAFKAPMRPPSGLRRSPLWYYPPTGFQRARGTRRRSCVMPACPGSLVWAAGDPARGGGRPRPRTLRLHPVPVRGGPHPGAPIPALAGEGIAHSSEEPGFFRRAPAGGCAASCRAALR